MHDAIEGMAICLSIGLVLLPPTAFILFVRYIGRKEKAALRDISHNEV